MKHIEKSPVEPERLANYREHHPRDTWDKFHKRDRVGYRQLKEQLLRDQHGLCAYCEISIRLSDNEDEVDDFRVEHFHPKSGTERSEHNYHLDWRNLLGVCHGGSQPYVAEARYRYASRVEDRSCDVPKSDKALENVILNPLEIPASARLFKYDPFTGAMEVDEETCPKGTDPQGPPFRGRIESELRTAETTAPGCYGSPAGTGRQLPAGRLVVGRDDGPAGKSYA
jgi:uncharacterized protein (TIGR02646 family)